MFKIWLIRHGMTAGNLKGRYIGKTDEHLCEQGRKALSELSYPEPDEIFVSPMIRCRETAEILFPGKRFRIIDQLAETDFGDFENKNYRELAGNPQYQQWVDSGGNLPFPGGESREEFRRRTLEGFQRVVGGDRPWGNDHDAYGSLRISTERFLQLACKKRPLLSGRDGP